MCKESIIDQLLSYDVCLYYDPEIKGDCWVSGLPLLSNGHWAIWGISLVSDVADSTKIPIGPVYRRALQVAGTENLDGSWYMLNYKRIPNKCPSFNNALPRPGKYLELDTLLPYSSDKKEVTLLKVKSSIMFTRLPSQFELTIKGSFGEESLYRFKTRIGSGMFPSVPVSSSYFSGFKSLKCRMFVRLPGGVEQTQFRMKFWPLDTVILLTSDGLHPVGCLMPCLP